MKIALIYLDVPNLGDLIIYETAKYIIEDILKRNHVKNYEIIPVDISSYKGRTTDNDIYGSKRILINKINEIVEKGSFLKCVPSIAQVILKKGGI